MGDPILKLDIGNSSLTISTKSKEAQKWFNQGLNMLHGFWHLEAYRAFEKVIELDPNCAMGYWGKAMCQPGFGGKEPPYQQLSYFINKEKRTKKEREGLLQ